MILNIEKHTEQIINVIELRKKIIANDGAFEKFGVEHHPTCRPLPLGVVVKQAGKWQEFLPLKDHRKYDNFLYVAAVLKLVEDMLEG